MNMNRLIAGLLAGLPVCWLPAEAQISTANEVLAPYKWEGKPRQEVRDRLVIYYFGSSECPSNELAQHYLAEAKAPAIPHVMVFKDVDGFEERRGHYIKRRILVGDYMGPAELTEWSNQGFPLWRLDAVAQEGGRASSPFEGRWSSGKPMNPHQVAELLELTVRPANELGRFPLALLEDGKPASVTCTDALLASPAKLTFTARDDSTVAAVECVLSLDERHMRLAFMHTNGIPMRSIVLERMPE